MLRTIFVIVSLVVMCGCSCKGGSDFISSMACSYESNEAEIGPTAGGSVLDNPDHIQPWRPGGPY